MEGTEEWIKGPRIATSCKHKVKGLPTGERVKFRWDDIVVVVVVVVVFLDDIMVMKTILSLVLMVVVVIVSGWGEDGGFSGGCGNGDIHGSSLFCILLLSISSVAINRGTLNVIDNIL